MRGLKGIRRILSVSLSALLLFSAAAVSLSVAAEEEPVILYAGDAVPAEHTAITSLTDALADSAYAGKAVVVYVYGNLYPTKQGISSGSGNYESITNVASVVIEGKENAALRCRQGDKVIFSLYANGIPTTLKNLSLYTCTVWGGGPFADAENTSLVVENCDQKGTTGVVNGGGLSTKVTGTASVKVTGSTLYSVSGGGMSESRVLNGAPADVNKAEIVAGEGNTISYVTGGSGSRVETTDVLVTGGTYTNVCGGGNGGPVGESRVVVDGETVVVTNKVYGGSIGGANGITNKAAVIIKDCDNIRDICGGALNALTKEVSIEIAGGTIGRYVFGGGYNGKVENTAVTITGGTVSGQVVASGKEPEATVENAKIRVENAEIAGEPAILFTSPDADSATVTGRVLLNVDKEAYSIEEAGDIDVTFTYITGVTLDKTSAKLEAGKTLQLKATVEPEAAKDKNIAWTSSDPAVAAVDENGLVTAQKEGNVTITATTVNGKTAACEITVEKATDDDFTQTGSGTKAVLALAILLASAAGVYFFFKKHLDK